MRKWTSAAVLVGLAVVALGAWQGTTVHQGDVRIDGANGVELTDAQGITITAPAVGERTVQRFLEATGDWAGTGLADAGHDVLTASVSTMNTSTWETVTRVTVDVPETTDRVLASVTGQFAWMGATVFVSNRGFPDNDTLCEIPDPETPAVDVVCRDLDSRITLANGLTTRTAGGLWVVDTTEDIICGIPNPTTPAVGVTCADLPSSIEQPAGMARRMAGGVWIVNTLGNELCELPNPATPTVDFICRALPVSQPVGITTRSAGGLWLVNDSFINELCEIPTPAAPSANVVCRELGSDIFAPNGVTNRSAGGLWVVDHQTDELCSVPDPVSPGSGVSCMAMDGLVARATGITEAGADGECMVRLARGTTTVEDLTWRLGRILLDTTFVDVPGVAGSTTYAVQMMTANPYTLCTAVRDTRGLTPLPSLLVQVFYGS